MSCCVILKFMSAVNLAFSLFHFRVLVSANLRCIVMRVDSSYIIANKIIHSKCQMSQFQTVASLFYELKIIFQDFEDIYSHTYTCKYKEPNIQWKLINLHQFNLHRVTYLQIWQHQQTGPFKRTSELLVTVSLMKGIGRASEFS